MSSLRILACRAKNFSSPCCNLRHFHGDSRPKRVAIGVSGGVDSTVAAHMLKQKGFEVVGVFMKNWDIADETGNCRADKEAEDAEYVCKKLDIPFATANFVKEYWTEVFEQLVGEYEGGLTPNPDIECNKRVKFGHFVRHCAENIGCDAVATGHYARTSYGDFLEHKSAARVKLLRSIDRIKDQSFFLSQVSQDALQNVMFPVGSLTKDVVKRVAALAGFQRIADKKESMGICFIGKRRGGFADFLTEYVAPKPGPIKDIETGETIGTHRGVHLWTKGQKVRIPRMKRKQFVVDKDVDAGTVYTCFGSDHPALYSENFYAGSPHWIDRAPDQLRDRSSDQTFNCKYRSQNTEPLSDVAISYGMSCTNNWEFVDTNSLIVSLAEPERAITVGQYAVFYIGDECLGSARITKVGPSLFTMNTNNCRDDLQASK